MNAGAEPAPQKRLIIQHYCLSLAQSEMMDGANASNESATSASVAPHDSVARTVVLHLLPGAFVFAFYVWLAPYVVRLGFPPGLTLLLGFLFVGIPMELGYLLHEGRKRNGKLSLHGIVLFRARMPTWQYAVLFILLFAFTFAALYLLNPATTYLARTVFAWLPTFLLPDGSSSYGPFARSAVLATLILGLIVDGIVNPIVEELYFRGYLLPRLSRFGGVAPLINAFLFALQHYWQPYNFPLIFIIQLAVVYVVWWKRNIYVSILAHSMGNLIGASLSLVGFLGSS